MYDFLIKIEQICLEFGSGSLLLVGLLSIVVGLFLWLGGGRYCRQVVGLLGAGIGVIAGYLVSQWFGLPTAASIAVGAVIFAFVAALMQNVIIIMVAIVIFASVCGTGYVGFLLKDPAGHDETGNYEQNMMDAEDDATAVADDSAEPDSPESLTESGGGYDNPLAVTGKLNIFLGKLKMAFDEILPTVSNNRGKILLWCVAGAVVGLILAQLLKIIIMALCCSIIGTTGVIVGVMLVMMGKGVGVVPAMEARPNFLPSLFLTMAVIGWLVQIFLVRSAGKKAADDEKD